MENQNTLFMLALINLIVCLTNVEFVTLYLYTFNYDLLLLYTNKLYSKILHPVTDEVIMLQTSNTRS
jgi:hypothetical protein